MCEKCLASGLSASWPGLGEASNADRLKGREIRVRLLRHLLAPRGVSVEASALGLGMRLSARDGTTLLTDDVLDVWPWVERVLGAAWDPLAVGADAGAAPPPRA